MKRRRFGLPKGYGRDPYKRRVKATAPYCDDPAQLSMDLWPKPVRRPAILKPVWPWSEDEPDLEQAIAASLAEEHKL